VASLVVIHDLLYGSDAVTSVLQVRELIYVIERPRTRLTTPAIVNEVDLPVDLDGGPARIVDEPSRWFGGSWESDLCVAQRHRSLRRRGVARVLSAASRRRAAYLFHPKAATSDTRFRERETVQSSPQPVTRSAAATVSRGKSGNEGLTVPCSCSVR